jgi:hypothetical protein
LEVTLWFQHLNRGTAISERLDSLPLIKFDSHYANPCTS